MEEQRNDQRTEPSKEPDEQQRKESLEELFAGLEAVLGEMEKDGTTLETSFELYSKGMDLLKKCTQTIDEVEKKVLILDEDGETHEF